MTQINDMGMEALQLVGAEARINYYKATEALLWSYPIMNAQLYITQNAEWPEEEQASQAEVIRQLRCQLARVNAALAACSQKDEWRPVGMYYLNEDADGEFRGLNARRYSWEEVALALGIDARTARRQRNRMIRALSVCIFGLPAAMYYGTDGELPQTDSQEG